MFRRSIKEINAEFLAEEKYLDSIQRTVRESCAASGMSKKDAASVLLAIEEAATNIIRHAYLYEKGIIRLRIIIYKKLVVFSLIDFGRSFQPDSSKTIDLNRLVESGRKGGLGFYMIQKIMDSVEYISTAGFNEMRMIKRIKDSSASSGRILSRMFSLRVKFSVWTFMIMSIIIGASIYYFDYRTSKHFYEHKADTITALGTTIADQASGYFINNRSDVEFDQMVVSYMRANPELKQIVLTDDRGLIQVHSQILGSFRSLYHPPESINPDQYYIAVALPVGDSLFFHIVTPIFAGERELGKVFLTYSTATIETKLISARYRILFLTMFLVLFGILGIYLLSNYFVTPILKITHRIRKFTSGDLETELPLEGAEEFFEISKALNQMMTRLSQDRKNLIEREKMAKEIELASEIQKTLMPEKLPDIPYLELDTFYRAASIVGGDLFDIFKIHENRYCLVLADVSGKGIPASLVTSMIRTVIQINAVKDKSATEILIGVNDYLKVNIPPGMFVTVFLMIYDSSEKSLQTTSAGHNPMLYYSGDKKTIAKINPKGMPLGLPEIKEGSFNKSLKQIDMKLNYDDFFIIFTDGITEAVDREGGYYGIERLSDIISENVKFNKEISVKELSQNIIDSIDDFTGFVKPADDITYILVKVVKDSEEIDTVSETDKEPVEMKNIGQAKSK